MSFYLEDTFGDTVHVYLDDEGDFTIFLDNGYDNPSVYLDAKNVDNLIKALTELKKAKKG